MPSLYKPSSIPWEKMTREQRRDEGYRWSDSIGKAQRAFLNHYGPELYQEWRRSRMPLKQFELLLNQRFGWLPSDATPIYNEFASYINGHYG